MPRYLLVLASTCQMYSGTGTAIFDWIRHCRTDFDFSILIDARVKENLDVTAMFCKKYGIPLHLSAPAVLPGCCDSGVRSVSLHLLQNPPEFVECVSWANASTNLSVLAAKLPYSKLIFTPHSQPIWTLQNYHRYFMTSPVFAKMIRSADAVFIDSPSEKRLPEFDGSDDLKIHFVPLGVNTALFADTGIHRPYQLTCVCDCRESRKRIDLLLQTFSVAHRKDPRLSLVLAGKGSDTISIPDHLLPGIKRLGYVTQPELIRLYQASALFVLLSDYEAFGLPIAEALCCGTPVLLNEQAVLQDLFADLPGVSWTSNTDIGSSAEKLLALAAGPTSFARVSQAAAQRFAFDRTYGKKRELVLNLLR
jgi:glycosyltransferase involved in cell wall biosynthesis